MNPPTPTSPLPGAFPGSLPGLAPDGTAARLGGSAGPVCACQGRRAGEDHRGHDGVVPFLLRDHLDTGSAVLALDAEGSVHACTPAAEEILGLPSRELRGRPVRDLFDGGDGCDADGGADGGDGSGDGADSGADGAGDVWEQLVAAAPHSRRAVLRHRGGARVKVRCDLLVLDDDAPIRFLLHVVPAALDERWRQDEALIRALFSQARIGLSIHNTELRLVRANLDEDFGPVGDAAYATGAPDTRGLPRAPRLDQVLVAEDAAAIAQALRRTVDSGETQVDLSLRARHRDRPETERIVSLSVLPLKGTDGRCQGVAAAFTDITDQYRARQRRALVNAAAKRIGTSLDVTHCAEEVTALLVPDFADLVAVDLTEVVLIGEEPGDFLRGAPLRRVATASSGGAWPAELHPLGASIRVRGMETAYLRKGSPFFLPDVADLRAAFSGDEERSRLLLPKDAASFMVVPLHARGLVLGSVMLWRSAGRTLFDQQDAELAEEIVSRAALVVDNARRYTRECRTAEALRRSLLPPAVVETSAAEAAGTCVPAETTEGIGGTWFDVIPLSSARVAFVVGDAVGQGMEATAATGRLRTAVQTLSDLDLAPEELLTHLDDLVGRLAADEEADTTGPAGERPAGAVKGSTCFYAVYDPTTGRCTMASAGHPPPAVIDVRYGTCLMECKAGPPLGTGGMPFEPMEVTLEPDTFLAFYSANLVVGRRERAAVIGPQEPAGDGDTGTENPLVPATRRLRHHLLTAARHHPSPADVSREALAHMVPEPPADDITLLVARVRALPADATASWEFPAEPSVVARAREAVTAKMAAWGLEELAFTTELIASELVTNAIRYAGAPVGLRLIRDKTLICEVSDPSQTQPHLRRARLTDEGGRGLFLVHQLAHRWGSRYTSSGKTIWTEQPLPPRGSSAPSAATVVGNL